MRRRFAYVIPAVIVGVALLLLGTQPAFAASGGWLDRSADHGASSYTGSAMDDPIVFPGQPGATHMHDFFCTRPNASSTYGDLANGPTVCPNDTGSYWAPALYKNGVKVDPVQVSGTYIREQIYYRGDNVSAKTITPYPADFRLITGNSHATSATDNPLLGREIYYGCSDNSESGKPKAPINCSTGIITIHYGFANCWDGVQTHANDSAHVVLPSSSACPASNPTPVPRLILRFEYPVGTSSAGITLSSGPTYTAHADFWNTWHQPTLEYLVGNCLNKGTDCGTNPAIPSSVTGQPGATVTPTSSPPPSSTAPASSASVTMPISTDPVTSSDPASSPPASSPVACGSP